MVSKDIEALDQVDSLSVLIFIKLCFSSPVTVGRMSVDMRTRQEGSSNSGQGKGFLLQEYAQIFSTVREARGGLLKTI